MKKGKKRTQAEVIELVQRLYDEGEEPVSTFDVHVYADPDNSGRTVSGGDLSGDMAALEEALYAMARGSEELGRLITSVALRLMVPMSTAAKS